MFLMLGSKQHWATCRSLCSSKHKVKDSEVFSLQDGGRHRKADVCFGHRRLLGSSGSRRRGFARHRSKHFHLVPALNWPWEEGLSAPPDSRWGFDAPKPLETFLVISGFGNRVFVAKNLHPWSPPWNLNHHKDGPRGFVSLEMCSSPIHVVSLWLSRSSSAFCSKQVFLHISSLWT